jgi:hypothetical protein
MIYLTNDSKQEIVSCLNPQESPKQIEMLQTSDSHHEGCTSSSDLKNLIVSKLHLDSEKYQDLSEDSYKILIDNLISQVNASQISEEEKIQLLELIDFNKSQEQRTLLQYAKDTEIEQIKKAFDHPKLDEIVKRILDNEWMSVFETHGKDETLSYVFLAAFCRQKISLDELATALMFHRAFFNAPEKCQIRELDGDYLHEMGPTAGIEESFLMKLPKNQQIALVFKNTIYDDYTKTIEFRESSINHQRIMGVKYHQDNIIILPFGLLRKCYKYWGFQLIPTLHLTPSFSRIADRLGKKKSDFALFLPTEETVIHGSQDKTIFSFVHDLFHATVRLLKVQYLPNMANIAKQLLSKKRELLTSKELQPYKSKLASDIEQNNPTFKVLPEENEFITFMIDRLVSKVIDCLFMTPDDLLMRCDDEYQFIFKILVENTYKESMQDMNNEFLFPHFDKGKIIERVEHIVQEARNNISA